MSSYLLTEKRTVIRPGAKCEGIIKEANELLLSELVLKERSCCKPEQLISNMSVKPEVLRTPGI